MELSKSELIMLSFIKSLLETGVIKHITVKAFAMNYDTLTETVALQEGKELPKGDSFLMALMIMADPDAAREKFEGLGGKLDTSEGAG